MSLVLINHEITSAHQVSQLTASLGYELHCHQLDVGPMNGYLRAVICGNQLFIFICVNKPMAIYGSRLKDYAAFGMFLFNENPNAHCHAHGHKATPNWSSSFSPNHDETFTQMAPNVPMLVGYVAHADLRQAATNWHEAEVLHKITTKEFAVFQPEAYERMVRATLYRIFNPSPDPDLSLSEQYILIMYDMFNQLSTEKKLVQTFKRFDLIKNFFRYALEKQHEPVKIKDVADALYTSNTTLIKGCYEVFGCKPMDVLKNIRLEQAHAVMSSKDLQYQMRLNKVINIAKYYGFESRPHFAKSYQAMYGMTPVESLSNSR
jgi:AraC family ethanolamine operon transcriptional activator